MPRNKTTELQHGDVVYFVDRSSVQVGVFDERIDSAGYSYVDLIQLADHRYIDGVPIQDFHSETEWRPLPKGWTYDTQLFKLEHRRPEWEQKMAYELRWSNPRDVKKALEKGVAVLSKNVFQGVIEAEIDRHKGFRVVKKYPHWTQVYCRPKTDYVRVLDGELFRSYDQAKKRLEEMKEIWKKEADMTDDEWSIAMISQDLARVDSHYAGICREFLLAMPDIWDVETKVSDGVVYWRRYENRTEWKPIQKGDKCEQSN